MLRISAQPIAVGSGAVPEHDPSDPIAGWCGEMLSVAAFVMNECRHERASPATIV